MPTARLVTALILVAAVLGCLFLLPAWASRLLFAGAVFAAGLEWAAIAGLRAAPLRVAYATAAPVLVTLGGTTAAGAQFLQAAILLGCLWWSVAVAWVTVYQVSGRPAAGNLVVLMLVGWLVLASALAAIYVLRDTGAVAVLALLVLVWSADTLAYFGGRRWGRRRLADRVSPGKTWAGLLSALFGTVAAAIGLNAAWFDLAPAVLLPLVVTTFVAAVYGDLFESLVKRSRGVKDSGALLPGHGGMLDRIDSLLAAAPVFAATLATLDLK